MTGTHLAALEAAYEAAVSALTDAAVILLSGATEEEVANCLSRVMKHLSTAVSTDAEALVAEELLGEEPDFETPLDIFHA